MPSDMPSDAVKNETDSKPRLAGNHQGHMLDAMGRIVTEDGLVRMSAAGCLSYSSSEVQDSPGRHAPSSWRNPGDHHVQRHHHYETHTAESAMTTTVGMSKHPYAGGFDPALKPGRGHKLSHKHSSPRVKAGASDSPGRRQRAAMQVRLVDSSDYSGLELHAQTLCRL